MDVTAITPASNSSPAPVLNIDVQNNAAQQQFSRLPLPATVAGIVMGSDKNGNLIVKMGGSDLLLSSPVALSKDAQVTLKIDGVSGSITATLLSVDGKLPASQPQALSNQLQQNPGQQGGKILEQELPSLKLVSVLSHGAARPVIQPQPQAMQAVVKADIVSLTSPQASIIKGIVISPSPEIIQGLKANLPLDETGKPINAKLANSLPEELKPGTQLNLKITNSQNPLPQQPGEEIATGNSVLGKQEFLEKAQTNMRQQMDSFQPSLKPAPNGNISMNALVLDTKPNGEMLVETKLGKVIIDGGEQLSTITKGSTLTLELSELTAAPKAGLALPEEELPVQQLSKNWPALKNLADHAEASGNPSLSTKLAGVENTFGAKIAGFANAMKTGDLRDWLGASTYDAMESDEVGSALLGKVKRDLGTMRDLFNQPNQAGWQTMLFPVFDGRELHQARLHVKDLPDEEKDAGKKAGTRFILEVETSFFGDMQFDGLVRANIAKHFDLMVRTHNPLDVDVQYDIRKIFNDTAEATGFKGDIEFATMKEFPVKIFEEMVGTNLGKQIDHKGIEA